MTHKLPTATQKEEPIVAVVEIENATTATNNSSTSSNTSISTSTIPYYGSREPKQSIKETDRVIFQMMDDIQISKTAFKEKGNDVELYSQEPVIVEKPTAATHHGILWRFRIVLSSIVILLLVVVTVVVSEITKKRS
ncbi:hypothetical protein HMPREF1544_08433 [Mucor circinelloides 1006PhL]|uniref:Uncharacterized protein n=1 Tax=Mucor circinelloides f. circinelloides (strain 1006PhL) TaxID=1220926 RepID=S2JY66_MUCC1|nr:hypothetical protein HMPREF1544_08433 [Mucor circinelloides 1006PhL]